MLHHIQLISRHQCFVVRPKKAPYHEAEQYTIRTYAETGEIAMRAAITAGSYFLLDSEPSVEPWDTSALNPDAAVNTTGRPVIEAAGELLTGGRISPRSGN